MKQKISSQFVTYLFFKKLIGKLYNNSKMIKLNSNITTIECYGIEFTIQHQQQYDMQFLKIKLPILNIIQMIVCTPLHELDDIQLMYEENIYITLHKMDDIQLLED